jgi:DNA-directed RNA polymerase subunit omega
MIEPSIDLLVTKVDSKYSLVVATARRARALVDGAPSLLNGKYGKPVATALKEIAEGKIKVIRIKDGIK